MVYNHFVYLLYWSITSIVIYLAGLLFPQDVVLGNYRLFAIDSAIYSGFWITFIVWTLLDFVQARGINVNKFLFNIIFFVPANIISIWLAARFAGLIGMGLVNYQWAVILGVTIYVFQKFVSGILKIGPSGHKKKKVRR